MRNHWPRVSSVLAAFLETLAPSEAAGEGGDGGDQAETDAESDTSSEGDGEDDAETADGGELELESPVEVAPGPPEGAELRECVLDGKEVGSYHANEGEGGPSRCVGFKDHDGTFVPWDSLENPHALLDQMDAARGFADGSGEG